MQIGTADRGPINVPTAFTTNDASFRADLDITDDLIAFLRLDYFDNDQTLQTRLSNNAQRTLNYAAGVAQDFGSDSRLALTAFGSDSRFKTANTGGFTGIPENEAEFVQNRHTTPVEDIGASLIWSQQLGEGWLQSYELGVDFHRIAGEDVADIFDETLAFVRTDIGRGKQRFWGVFAQADLAPLDHLEVIASLRYQTFENYDAFDGAPGGLGAVPDTDEESLDPRVSVRYQLTEELAVRGAAYTAFRAPNLDNLYRAFSVPFGVFQPNAALIPESLEGGEVGFDLTTETVRLQVTAYYNTIEDLITSRNLDFSELPPGFFFGSRNINAGSAEAQGFEAEAEWALSPEWSTRFAYTFADSEVTENALDPASVGKQIGGVPKNRASVSLTYESAGWRVTPQFRWLEKSFADNAHTLAVDEQSIVDLSVSYRLTDDVEAYVQVENLFDQDYIADNSGFNPPLRGTPLSAFFGLRVALR
jgi:outer membrane receptor protein involved in Fe transport